MRIGPLNQHIGAIRDFERLPGVLFHHQDRQPGARNLDDPVEELIHDNRADPGGRFIQHQHLGLRHQGTPDRNLLTLPAGELSCRLKPLFPKDRKQLINV